MGGKLSAVFETAWAAIREAEVDWLFVLYRLLLSFIRSIDFLQLQYIYGSSACDDKPQK